MSKTNLCQCCLAEGCSKDLEKVYLHSGQLENYGAMLAKTFNLTVHPIKHYICENCIKKLRAATTFKQQIEKSVHSLHEMCMQFDTYDDSEETDIKSEPKEDMPQNGDTFYDDYRVSNDSSVKSELDSDEKPLVTQMKQNTETQEARHNTIKLIMNSNICPFKSLRTRYQCYLCCTTSTLIGDLRKHILNHNKKDMINRLKRLRGLSFLSVDISDLTCKICLNQCPTVDSLQSHLTDSHGVIFLGSGRHLLTTYRLRDGFECVVCTDTFKTFIRLAIHMNSHSTSNVCEICGLSFYKRESLNNHRRMIHKEQKCNRCSLTFPTATACNRHKIKFHDAPPSRHFCKKCSMSFKYTYLVQNHMEKVHGACRSSVDCDQCGKTLKNVNSLKIHVRSVHIRERKFPCSQCESRFFTKVDKLRHERTHLGVTEFSCDLCETRFKSKDSVKRHMRRKHSSGLAKAAEPITVSNENCQSVLGCG